ncbi:secondary thiamine-phosphate synthase enzyme YjbQ [Candidatus Albibeggiatoa sp. nov. BB20]|uniref:secondary thiamine-phosphate synthase enzyme YjbQ n=1 Tax=Candidatus Albibeggiatoa sp. nov. BB20 TaxID=3162723 RepID=UPI00336571F3
MPVKTITVQAPKQGLFEFTHQVENLVSNSQIQEGLCTLFVRHTSASLLIQENADPSAKRDLENWLNRLVPEHDSLYTHISEGADDMPSHIKSTLTATHLSIPILNGQLALGTWQGIFLWEHRYHGGNRSVVIHIGE